VKLILASFVLATAFAKPVQTHGFHTQPQSFHQFRDFHVRH